MMNSEGKRERYKVNDDGLFVLKNDKMVINPNNEVGK